MVSVCTVPARGGRSCEHFGGYKTLNRIPLPLPFICYPHHSFGLNTRFRNKDIDCLKRFDHPIIFNHL